MHVDGETIVKAIEHVTVAGAAAFGAWWRGRGIPRAAAATIAGTAAACALLSRKVRAMEDFLAAAFKYEPPKAG